MYLLALSLSVKLFLILLAKLLISGYTAPRRPAAAPPNGLIGCKARGA